ncbi:hypothetical protein V6N11_083961 [Hibiscus sabdariffa]|uniref:RNase H type-1 domain-containing protein n=1 Tax=Hibiscus sabdariffa TaxID=183260 RepID=A0ABR2QD97_9ROSI
MRWLTVLALLRQGIELHKVGVNPLWIGLSNRALVVNIRELLSRSWEVRIRLVPREANSVSDKLVTMARGTPLSTQVYANPPSDILQLVADDIGSQSGQAA